MNQEIFDREINMCRRLSRENGGKCNWSECETCGVIPLLYKLHKGVLIEKKEEVEKVKKEIFGNEVL